MTDQGEPSTWTRRSINVADPRMGDVALSASDEFFAPKERMLQPTEPEWRAGVYDANGKWMDGWESRRRRDAGHDFCVIQLAAATRLSALEIDTRHFTGNYPPFASVQACRLEAVPNEATTWSELLPRSALSGNQQHFFPLKSESIWTHLKLNIFPDGGVARFRAYGSVQFDWKRVAQTELIDLAAALHGGFALACNDEHYGAMGNLLLPGQGATMADGWETRRRREPGHDWVIVRLGHRGRVRQVDIDTAHYKGNFPHQVSIHGARIPAETADADLPSQSSHWPLLLEPQYLKADSMNRFETQLRDLGPITHARVNIHPDGGLNRVRLLGHPDLDR